MGDWIGLGFFVLVVVGAIVGLSFLGRTPKKLTEEEFKRRVAESRGTMSAGVMGTMYALQKLMNPKAAEAVESLKDLEAGYYNLEDAGRGGEDAEVEHEDGGDEVPPSRKKNAGLTVVEDDEEGDDA